MLKEHEDAMGRAYLDYLNGRIDTNIIIDRDDGESERGAMGFAVYFSTYPDWPPRQREALEHVTGRVLDVGCGAGRHSLYLQEKGHDVVGIDESPLAIHVCKARGIRNAQALRFTQVSRALRPFDTIIMLGNNFGLFGSFKRARWMLRRLRGMTSPNARIIAETLDPYKTENPLHLAYHERNRQRGRMGGQIRLRARYEGYTSPWFDYLFVSEDELRDLLDGTGWRVGQLIRADEPAYTAIIVKDAAPAP